MSEDKRLVGLVYVVDNPDNPTSVELGIQQDIPGGLRKWRLCNAKPEHAIDGTVQEEWYKDQRRTVSKFIDDADRYWRENQTCAVEDIPSKFGGPYTFLKPVTIDAVRINRSAGILRIMFRTERAKFERVTDPVEPGINPLKIV